MVEHLLVKNVALIENVEIDFGKGLNILSGETGAGKSMLIDAINFLLGERTGKDFIRHGTESALVEGLFSVREDAADVLKELGIDINEDGMLLITRMATAQGKTTCKANGRSITVGMLREVSKVLIDVHGQHEHQSLLNPNEHIVLLDRFCAEEMEPLKTNLAECNRKYKDVAKKIKAIVGDAKGIADKIEMLTFQKEEIEEAHLTLGEEESLLERKKVLAGSERLTKNTTEALELLYGYEEETRGAADMVSRATYLVQEVAELDQTKEHLADRLDLIQTQLTDLVRELRYYAETLEYDPHELDRMEERLDLLYRLKRKYGNSVADVLQFYQNVVEQLDFYQDSEQRLEQLNQEKKKHIEHILEICKAISEVRKQAAEKIQQEIVTVLQELGMKNARFNIEIDRKKEFSNMGYDKVEFLISPNPGEPLKPLAQIASGGEMSRIMLAVKTVLADVDTIETFIFDEIDAGVSGRTAQQVAEKLALIAQKHQILCITHLPQIAAMGNTHFLIEKSTDGESTKTQVYSLSLEKAILELARLLGGAKITDATMQAAREMKEQANQFIQ